MYYEWIELFDSQVPHAVENEPPLTETSSDVSPFAPDASRLPHTPTESPDRSLLWWYLVVTLPLVDFAIHQPFNLG